MKLDKAIRRLQGYVKYRKPDPDDCFHEAVQLGIEALKDKKRSRSCRGNYADNLLPGETEE